MKLTLSKRIIGAVIISVLVGSTSALISSFFLLRGFDEQAQKDVELYSLAVQGQLDSMQDKAREAAPAVAGRSDVARAVKRGDTAYIQEDEIVGSVTVGADLSMDNPKVIETVLQQGKPFQNINTIIGREYNTAYWPLRDIEGRIAGMLFIGKDRAAIMQTQREMVVTVGISVLVIVGLMALAAFFIARSIAGPIQRVSQGLSDEATEQAAAIEETSSALEERWPP